MWPCGSNSSQEKRHSQSSPHRRTPSSQPDPPSPRTKVLDAGAQGPQTPQKPAFHRNDTITGPSAAAITSPFDELGPSAPHRVFPIRSVVSVDPNPTPTSRSEQGSSDGFPGMSLSSTPRQVSTSSNHSQNSTSESSPVDALSRSRRSTDLSTSRALGGQESKNGPSVFRRRSSEGRERRGGSRQIQTFVDTSSVKSESISSQVEDRAPSFADSTRSLADDSATAQLVTARFKHLVTEGGHAVITGRDGDTIQRCEDEPISIPGAIQSFGLLIALHEEDDGKLKVRIVSENSERIIGYTPKELFALDNFCDILSDDQTDNLLDHVDFIREDDADPATNGPDVFTLAIRHPRRRTQKMWCAMHVNERNPDLVICEFELEDDQLNPLVPTGEDTPEPPEDTLHSAPTPEEYAESTVNMSKPLRVLRSARKRKGEAAAMEVFNIMSQVQEQLANAPTLDVFLKILVGVVKELTGFHRVMIYQFDQSWNGRVVTELVDPRATKDLYKGLNFPASDIPPQARALYKINKVRLLYDRGQETARLVCRTVDDLETPLDLTFAYLRAMSPIHIKYLANMAVRASMSISINAFGELWGLIACHSYGSKGMRVSFPIRKMCRLIGDSASHNIERLSYASRLQARKLINTAPTESNPSGYIVASSDDLLKLFDADYGLLSIRGETKILGKLEQTQEALAMLEYLRLRQITSVTQSTDIRIDFPDLQYSPGFNVIAGLLLVPLSAGGQDFIVFFRKGQIREVKWAGNPYEKFIKEGTEGYLEPRKSFKSWSETVVGKSREWTEEQADTAAVLCLVYGKFIEVWRQKEAALQNSQLTRLLLANSAHEVRTPLNAIINYLEIALEGAIDQETRDYLAKSHSASKSLIYVINDLLDLTKTEEGHNLIKDETFDLPATIREAADSFAGDARRKQLEYEATINSLPQYVVGDQRRVRQAISNVTANAIKYTSIGAVKIEAWLAAQVEGRVEVAIAVQDTGVGMPSKKLDALFRELEQVQSESDEGLQEKLASDTKTIESGNEERTLGLGLALVARIVRNMNGQLRLKSEEGKGSRFVMQFSFALPDSATQPSPDVPNTVEHDFANSPVQDLGEVSGRGILQSPSQDIKGIQLSPEQPTTPPMEAGEVMLVNKSAQKGVSAETRDLVRRVSNESLKSTKSISSLKSLKSGSSVRSVDRLIDAIQEPAMPTKSPTPADGQALSSSNSGRGSRPGSSSSSRPVMKPRLYRSMTGESATHQIAGQSNVQDSKTPIRPIRVPNEESTGPVDIGVAPRTPARVLFDFPDESSKRLKPLDASCLDVLVAEDDPINSKIVKKRLEKLGHVIHLTVNGEECSSTYGEQPNAFDVILMDMQVCNALFHTAHFASLLTQQQMPIVDGLTSTKLIRSYEKSHPLDLSKRASLNGRIPIIAVSASLLEKEIQTYLDAGFDGWILKPIDFKRLRVLLEGIVEQETRASCLYKPGEWEKGGWFVKHQPDVFSASTAPSKANPVSKSYSDMDRSQEPSDDPTDQERQRLESLNTDAVHAESAPDHPGDSGNVSASTLRSSASGS